LTDEVVSAGHAPQTVLQLAASLERYSKHPLAAAVLQAATLRQIPLLDASGVSERPGQGLIGEIDGHRIEIVGRREVEARGSAGQLPGAARGLECHVLIDDEYAATYRFHDAPRPDSRLFVDHLAPGHGVTRVLLVTGDREEEARYVADLVGIREVYAGQSPEDKVAITRAETARAPTLFLGDGINDAPAMVTATVGVAFGHQAEITGEAAGAVIMDASLRRVDELIHIGRRMRRIALQSAVGGMALSIVGMLLAAAGYLPPVAGAVFQEVIDLAAVLNALRAAVPGAKMSDY
jgi:cation transport ATPase